MKIRVFGKQGCPRCESTKRKLSHFLERWGGNGDIELDFVDMDTVEGMAEGAFEDVVDVPTTVISDNGTSLARWEGEVPPSEAVKNVLQGK